MWCLHYACILPHNLSIGILALPYQAHDHRGEHLIAPNMWAASSVLLVQRLVAHQSSS